MESQNNPLLSWMDFDSKLSEEIFDSSKIINDGVIFANASLAKVLLDDPTCPKENKVFLGIKEGHNTSLSYQTTQLLGTHIEKMLSK
ncbi:MAG: hypothetical protein H0W50_09000 [Parachlamydiaceae bacterium]|nr:hypothetical protein [Parachlamydiaceae bacterium]